MENSLKHLCGECSKDTNHLILFSKMIEEEITLDIGAWKRTYSVVECKGCNNLSFRLEYDFPFFKDDESDVDIKVYPPVIEGHIELDVLFLPDDIQLVYEETIKAFANDCFLLAAVGFRAVIEAVCKDQRVLGNDIVAKIDNLQKKGFLSKKEADRLHAVRFLGNDSVHAIKIPTEDQLNTSLDIIKHLLKTLYLLSVDELDTIIRDYKGFEKLVTKSIGKKSKNEEVNLNTILGRNIRRIDKEDLLKFEENLIERIKKEDYKKLELGKIVNGKDRPIQNYIIV